MEGRDSTRVVGARADQARPLRIYVWYPAAVSPGVPPMRFGRYAALAEDDVWPIEIVGPLREKLSYSRHALAQSLGPDGFKRLGEQPVRALEDAEPLAGPFPLIVIGQGLYYESPIAFAALSEYLAGRGFVVATCPLVGTHSPLVKLDVEDLETQVRDLEFVIAQARRLPSVHPAKLGVLGFDMGGSVGLILTMRNRDVDAFVSIDTDILFDDHPSGLPQSSPYHDPLALRVPWLHAVQPALATPGPDNTHESLFDTAVHSDRYLVVVNEMDHAGFTSYALVEGRNAVRGYWADAQAGTVERHKAVSRYVSHFFAAFLSESPGSLAFLSRNPDSVSGVAMTLEHRAATPGPITYAEFVDALFTDRTASAIDDVRALRETEPSSILLKDYYLGRLAANLLSSWGRGDEAMHVSKLNVELNPSSALALRMLSTTYASPGDYAAAIETHRKLLEMEPDNANVRRILEWLQSQEER